MTNRPDTKSDPDLALYHYWRSSAAYRVRIALNLKGLSYKVVPVDLIKDGGRQHQRDFRALNPQGLVPVLMHEGHAITQSLAICEYLDECFEAYPLLPADALQRARTRALALNIACDIHPLNNVRVLQYLQDQFGSDCDKTAWMQHWMGIGFSALEKQLEISIPAGGWVNSRPGLFECFLVPQVYNAERFELDMSRYPIIQQVTEHCRALSDFEEAAPENQPDAT